MFNKEEILKMKKWDKDYKRIYQQLYYRLKTDKITATEYDIFISMKNKLPQQRGIYMSKNSCCLDNIKVKNLPKAEYKILDKPILITFD